MTPVNQGPGEPTWCTLDGGHDGPCAHEYLGYRIELNPSRHPALPWRYRLAEYGTKWEWCSSLEQAMRRIDLDENGDEVFRLGLEILAGRVEIG